ncbi:hypothetical protein H310_15056 [Aphanomyces invadans]|uniref:Uncharacterized protein n=1 Tax=Aphanomyces invadans TaxID=157072 RepID=A0A024T9T6_9STRA|nr:hypothetical protein H310_15056 [Aphanomyces invadans]ETV90112.1 hypothetical protein H310_15056 [Aphanomyces invadans]|eukprot:XP_008881256.1 hypothetical protein H310_15056 [Aphanomyces invadans]
MAIPLWNKAILVALTVGVIVCFVYVGTLPPAYANHDPPPFNTDACAACANYSTCPNVFDLGGSVDMNEGFVCRSGDVTCCCPHNDPKYNVRCADQFSGNYIPSKCQCRYERLCGESCFFNEGLAPMLIGIAGCIVLVCFSICTCCWHCRSRRNAPPPTARAKCSCG